MQRLEASSAVRPLYGFLGVKGLNLWHPKFRFSFNNRRQSLDDKFSTRDHSRCRFFSYEILLEVNFLSDRRSYSCSKTTKNDILMEQRNQRAIK